MLAASAADMDAEFAGERRQAAFQRAEHARGDARRMPVHSHDGAERLEPEWMGEPAQQFIAAVFEDDRLADHSAQPGHALAQPVGARGRR